jgi:hypothetical protein
LFQLFGKKIICLAKNGHTRIGISIFAANKHPAMLKTATYRRDVSSGLLKITLKK